MLNKRGTISENIIYLAIYLVISLSIIQLIKVVPASIFSKTIEVQEQENIIYAERIYEFLSEKDSHTKQTRTGKIEKLKDLSQEFNDFNSIKYFGAMATLDNKWSYYNQEFYEDAAPLAPGKYKLYINSKPIIRQGNNTLMNISTVFSTKLRE